MEEIWKDIKGYEGLYQVSNLGRVKSCDRYMNNKYHTKTLKKGRVLVNSIFPTTGYCRVSLSKNGTFISKTVHQLVANAFIPNPNKYTQINHKDENKTNNCVDNLEWCSSKYNNNYGKHSNNIAKTRLKNKKGFKKVIQYNKDLELINVYDSTREAARLNNAHNSIISRCCRGLRKDYLGYIWKYETQ